MTGGIMPLLDSTKELIRECLRNMRLNSIGYKNNNLYPYLPRERYTEVEIEHKARVKELHKVTKALPDLDKLALCANVIDLKDMKFKHPDFQIKKRNQYWNDDHSTVQRHVLINKYIVDDPDCLWLLAYVPYNVWYEDAIDKYKELAHKFCQRFIGACESGEIAQIPTCDCQNRLIQLAYETVDDHHKFFKLVRKYKLTSKTVNAGHYVQRRLKAGEDISEFLKELAVTNKTWDTIPITEEILKQVPAAKALRILARMQKPISITLEAVNRLLFPLINDKEMLARVQNLLRDMAFDYRGLATKLMQLPHRLNHRSGVHVMIGDVVEFLAQQSKNAQEDTAAFLKFIFIAAPAQTKDYMRVAYDEALKTIINEDDE